MYLQDVMQFENELRNDIFVAVHVSHCLVFECVFKNIYYITN